MNLSSRDFNSTNAEEDRVAHGLVFAKVDTLLIKHFEAFRRSEFSFTEYYSILIPGGT